MLPFDNKNEFQVIVDMPDGTTLEQTAGRRAGAGRLARKQPEVVNSQIYAGRLPLQLQRSGAALLPAPRPQLADIQVNLLPQGTAKRAEPRDRQAGAHRDRAA